MKLDRTDAGSLAAVVCSALAAMGVTGLVAARASLDVDPIERAERAERVERVRASGEQAEPDPKPRDEPAAAVSSSLEPLLFVDGVRMMGDRDVVLSGIDPDDIDRVEVIKGETAVERFGEEASAGVIEIFLKEIDSARPGG